ncbi:hypothetical protein M3Y99_00428700 [Aphelenchoides fujianensis]|nr:hypothetical protein M3Y99_00428700 [Aphelenchoides fujianensis]
MERQNSTASTQSTGVQSVKTVIHKCEMDGKKQLQWIVENFDVLSQLSALNFAQRFGPFADGISIKLSIAKEAGGFVLHTRVEPTTHVIWVNIRFRLEGDSTVEFDVSGDPRDQPTSVFKSALPVGGWRRWTLTFEPEILSARTEVLEGAEQPLIDLADDAEPTPPPAHEFRSPRPNARPPPRAARSRTTAQRPAGTLQEAIQRVVQSSLNTALYCGTEILRNYSAYQTFQTLGNPQQTRESLEALRERLNGLLANAQQHAGNAAEVFDTVARQVAASTGETNCERIRETLTSLLEHYQTMPPNPPAAHEAQPNAPPPVPPRHNVQPEAAASAPPAAERVEVLEEIITIDEDEADLQRQFDQLTRDEEMAEIPPVAPAVEPSAPAPMDAESRRSSFEHVGQAEQPQPSASGTQSVYPVDALRSMFTNLQQRRETRAVVEPDWSFVFESKGLSGLLRHIKHSDHSLAFRRRIAPEQEWRLPDGKVLHVELVPALHPDAPFICSFKEDPPMDMAFVQTLVDGHRQDVHRIDSFTDSFRGFTVDQLLQSAAVDGSVRVRLDAIPSMD